MRNVILFLILLAFSSCVKAQYPTVQNLGGDSTLVWSKGGLKLRPVIISYADTTAANAQRIKSYPFSMISTTGDNSLWYRNSAATQWVKFNSSENTTPPSVVNIITDSSISICNVNSCDTFVVNVTAQTINVINDSTIIICSYGGSCDTITINPTPIVPTQKFVDSIYSRPAIKTDTLIYNKNGDSVHVKVYDRNCGLIIPGNVTYDSLLRFSVSPAVYILCSDGVRRTSIQTQITLAAADATDDRFDAIVLDSNGVNKVTGTPSADPAQPQINPDQILLTYILVAAGDTTPTEIVNCANPDKTIYDENTGSPEWSHTNTVTANFNSTTTPYHLTKAVAVSSYLGGENIIFTPPAALVVNNYTTLTFHINLTGAMQQSSYFRISWETSSGSAWINVFSGSWGFNRSTLGYQKITIPISEFSENATAAVRLALSTSAVVPLKITFGNKYTHSLFIDYIQLGGSCITQPPPSTTSDNSFGIVTTASGTANSTKPTDILTVVGAGTTTVSATGKTLTITGAGISADNGLTEDVANNIQLGASTSTGSPLLHHTFLYGNSTYTLNLNNLRFENDKGADVAAANDLTLGLDGNVFGITGATQINAITTANWQAGSVIRLIFASTPTVKHNTAGGAGTAVILLAGGVDFVAGANDVLTLVYNGTSWYETSRKVAATGGTGVYTANSGLTMTANNTQLGSTSAPGSALLQDSYINTGGFYIKLTGTATPLWSVTSNVLSAAILGTNSSSGSGVEGTSSSGYGGGFTSTSGTALTGQTTSGLPILLQAAPSSTNTVITLAQLSRQTSGTGANGLGGSIDFYLEPDANTSNISNQLISKWTTAATATRTSQFIITGVNSGTTGDIAYFNGNGMVGIGSDAASATRLNIVDNSVGAASIMNISSTSTAAASNSQKGLNIALSGANATASQSTYGIYSSNTHTGSVSINYAGYFIASGGAVNYGVYTTGATYGLYGVSTGNGVGVYGIVSNSGGIGVIGENTVDGGIAIQGISNNSYSGYFKTNRPSLTNNVLGTVNVVSTSSGGVGANGIGGSIVYQAATSVGGSSVSTSNELISKWTDATFASRTSQFIITGLLNATSGNILTLNGDKSIQLTPITATAASAITPAEGMILFVSDTNGTFVSIGLWCYQNSAWKAL